MNELSIGILGGMGPRATIEFEKRLIDSFVGSDQSMPKIITINNSQIPDRSNFIQQNGQDPLKELIFSAKILRSAAVDIVCMPCNTAHDSRIMARLMAVVPLPIIDMPAACMLLAERQGFQRLLILGTEGTASSRLFDNRSTTISCIYPNDREQYLLNKVIATIKTGNLPNLATQQNLKTILKSQPIDALVLACTELSILPRRLFKEYEVIDSLDCLVQQCVKISETLNLCEVYQ